MDKKPIILVIDDEIVNFILIEESLIHLDFQLYHSPNGKIGLELYENLKPDLIFLDIRMPIMNGYEVAKQIRVNDKTTPIVAQTAYNQREETDLALDVGCNQIIIKPLTSKIINKIVAEIFK